MWVTNIHPETLPVIVALRKDTFKHCANPRLWMLFQTMIFKHWRAIFLWYSFLRNCYCKWRRGWLTSQSWGHHRQLLHQGRFSMSLKASVHLYNLSWLQFVHDGTHGTHVLHRWYRFSHCTSYTLSTLSLCSKDTTSSRPNITWSHSSTQHQVFYFVNWMCPHNLQTHGFLTNKQDFACLCYMIFYSTTCLFT